MSSKKRRDIRAGDSFTNGELYFMCWYPDAEQLCLAPDSLVFVGKNVEEPADDNEDRWYFQDTNSYCTKGVFTGIPATPSGSSAAISVHVYRLRAQELTQIVDCNGLRLEIARCIKRRGAARSRA